ncbi:hypothetical protein [Streptomyces tendae]|uniref:hypothetical protein n=1 Tax=Streptomyces tendae TaxID=1932 RepID=UPI003425F8F1
MTTDQPVPLLVTRHQCPHCRRYTRAKRERVEQHMPRCWSNPDLRTCKTCVHFEPGQPSASCWGDPYCNCPEVPDECAVGAWPDGVPYPMTNCPSWTARKGVDRG